MASPRPANNVLSSAAQFKSISLAVSSKRWGSSLGDDVGFGSTLFKLRLLRLSFRSTASWLDRTVGRAGLWALRVRS